MYDADGEITEVIDPLRAITTYVYDADNQLTDVISPLRTRTTYTYDNGVLELEKDPLGRVTTFVYDAAGQLTGDTGNTDPLAPVDFAYVASAPEPSSLALILSGLATLLPLPLRGRGRGAKRRG